MDNAKTKILCVDDEPNVLEGLSLHLRRNYDVLTAPGGCEALEILGREGDIAVVMSDMRMPRMDGNTLLAKAREVAPDATIYVLNGLIPGTPPVYADGDFDRMIAETRPGTVIVTSRDSTHDHYICRAMERLCRLPEPA